MMSSPGNQSDLNGNSGACPVLQTSASLSVFIGLHSLLFLVGSCLNGFSLYVHFCSRPKPRCSVSVYLRNLAIADLLLSLSLPIKIAHYASDPALWSPALWSPASTANSSAPRPLHRFYCSVGAAFFYLNMYNSILFMGYIAANRYLKIVRPLASHWLQSYRGSCLVSGLTWLTMLTLTCIYMGLSLCSSHGDVPVRSLSCDSDHSPEMELLYRVVHSCLTVLFLCVLLALLFFYCSISRRLREARGRLGRSSRKLQRAQRNMLLLWVVFCACFVPYHAVRLPFALLRGHCFWGLYFLKELSVLLSALNVCLDPLIYFLFSQSFRERLGPNRLFTAASTMANATANYTANANVAIADSDANAKANGVSIGEAQGVSDIRDSVV